MQVETINTAIVEISFQAAQHDITVELSEPALDVSVMQASQSDLQVASAGHEISAEIIGGAPGVSQGGSFSQALLHGFDATYLYFGFDDPWYVRRVVRADGLADQALPADNTDHADLAEAWVDRETLTYS